MEYDTQDDLEWLSNLDVETIISRTKSNRNPTPGPITPTVSSHKDRIITHSKGNKGDNGTYNKFNNRRNIDSLKAQEYGNFIDQDSESIPTDNTDAVSVLQNELFKLFDGNCASSNEDIRYMLTKGMEKLLPYQKRGIARMLKLKLRCLVFDEMGLGKSIQALYAASVFSMAQAEKGKNKEQEMHSMWPSILIIVPGSLRNNWNDEIEKWLPMISLEDVQVLKSRKDMLFPHTKYVICSYRMLDSHFKTLLERKFTTVIVDESHRTRTHNSSQSLYISCLCQTIPHILLLTGTPMLIRPFELYVQLDIILCPDCKNLLVPMWGNSSYNLELSQTQLEKKYTIGTQSQSHLDKLLNSSFMSVKEMARYLLVDISHKVGNEVFQLQKDDLKVDFQAAWENLSREAKVFCSNVVRKLSDFFLFSLRELISNEALQSKSYFLPLKQLAYGKFNPMDLTAQQFMKESNSLRKTWSIMNTEEPFLVGRLAKMWDAHRFGILFCDGKLRHYGIPGRRYKCKTWEYNGCNTSMNTLLVKTIRKYMIRRKKTHVLKDLPKKIRSHVLVDLDLDPENNQKESENVKKNPGILKNQTIQDSGRQNITNTVQTVDKNSRNKQQSQKQPHQLNCLKTLSAITNLPPDQLTYELQRVGIAKAPFIAAYLLKLLENSDMGHRFVVFAVHRKVLEIIRSKLMEKRGHDPSTEKYLRYANEICTGLMPTSDRAAIVHDFQNNNENGPRVLLCSILAMGVGFTLTRSSTVLMSELHWSPQLLKQAEDRCHRIGQKDSVYVQYMCAPNTLDYKLWPILSTRMERIESTLGFSKYNDANNKTRGKGHANILLRKTNLIPVDFEMSQTSAIKQLELKKPIHSVLSLDVGRSTEKLSQGSHSQTQSQSSQNNIEPNQLHFRVNPITHRIHLYGKTQENGQRRNFVFKHLKENFSPGDFMFIAEEWVQHTLGGPRPAGRMLRLLPVKLRNPDNEEFALAQAFVHEWSELKVADKNKLLHAEKPMRSPLILQLANNDKLNKEVASFERISHPDQQMHRSACRELGSGKYVVCRVHVMKRDNIYNKNNNTYVCYHQAFSKENAKPLCIYCGKTYRTKHSLNMAKALLDDVEENTVRAIKLQATIKSLFCDGKSPCYSSWHLKCFQSSARTQLRRLEAGVCRLCNTDTVAMCRMISAFPPGSVDRIKSITCPDDKTVFCPHYRRMGGSKTRIHWSQTQISMLTKEYLQKLKTQARLTEGMFWEADHKTAVCLGGGTSSIDNFQTLCIPCHRSKTRSDLHKRNRKMLGLSQLKHIGVVRTRRKEKKATTKEAKTLCKPCGIEFPTWEESTSHELICPFIMHSKKTSSSLSTKSQTESESESYEESKRNEKSKSEKVSKPKLALLGLSPDSDSSDSEDDNNNMMEMFSNSGTRTNQEHEPKFKRHKIYHT